MTQRREGQVPVLEYLVDLMAYTYQPLKEVLADQDIAQQTQQFLTRFSDSRRLAIDGLNTTLVKPGYPTNLLVDAGALYLIFMEHQPVSGEEATHEGQTFSYDSFRDEILRKVRVRTNGRGLIGLNYEELRNQVLEDQVVKQKSDLLSHRTSSTEEEISTARKKVPVLDYLISQMGKTYPSLKEVLGEQEIIEQTQQFLARFSRDHFSPSRGIRSVNTTLVKPGYPTNVLVNAGALYLILTGHQPVNGETVTHLDQISSYGSLNDPVLKKIKVRGHRRRTNGHYSPSYNQLIDDVLADPDLEGKFNQDHYSRPRRRNRSPAIKEDVPHQYALGHDVDGVLTDPVVRGDLGQNDPLSVKGKASSPDREGVPQNSPGYALGYTIDRVWVHGNNVLVKILQRGNSSSVPHNIRTALNQAFDLSDRQIEVSTVPHAPWLTARVQVPRHYVSSVHQYFRHQLNL